MFARPVGNIAHVGPLKMFSLIISTFFFHTERDTLEILPLQTCSTLGTHLYGCMDEDSDRKASEVQKIIRRVD